MVITHQIYDHFDSYYEASKENHCCIDVCDTIDVIRMIKVSVQADIGHRVIRWVVLMRRCTCDRYLSDVETREWQRTLYLRYSMPLHMTEVDSSCQSRKTLTREFHWEAH